MSKDKDHTDDRPAKSDDPPGAVSDQNSEEAESGLRDDETHPEPRTSGDRRKQRDCDAGHDRSGGGAGEGSQSTGDPNSAG